MIAFDDGIAVWADQIATNLHRRLPKHFDLDDLKQEARIAAWRKTLTYDPALNDNFQAYAFLAVRGACLMICRRKHAVWHELRSLDDVYGYGSETLEMDGVLLRHGYRALEYAEPEVAVMFADEERIERQKLEIAKRRLTNNKLLRRRHKLQRSYDALAKSLGVGEIRARKMLQAAEARLKAAVEEVG
jgi:DNA-directed RNA polymerase specialized sigma24 family protein